MFWCFDTEWPFIFWGGSGPLQLGVVLVSFLLFFWYVSDSILLLEPENNRWELCRK